MKYWSMIALLALSACGGSSYDAPAPVTPAPTPTPAPAPMDAFIAAVLTLIGSGAESNAEPMALDAVTPTAPEDKEAQAL